MITRKKIYTCFLLLFCAPTAALSIQNSRPPQFGVISTTGNQITIEMPLDQTVEDLKQEVEDKEGIKKNEQRLLLKLNPEKTFLFFLKKRYKELDSNDKTLASYGVEENSKITLKLKYSLREMYALNKDPKNILFGIIALVLVAYSVVRLTTKKKAQKGHNKKPKA